MAITTTITERDKKLLLGLGVFLTLFGFGGLIIKPALDEMTDLKMTQIPAAKTEQNMARIQIASIPGYHEQINTAKGELEVQAERFFPMMSSQQIDDLLTNEALAYGFGQEDLRSLSISVPAEGQYSALGMFGQTGTSSGSSDADVSAFRGVYAADVTMMLYGTRETTEHFLDLLEQKYRQIHVTAVNWLSERGYDGEPAGSVMSISMQLFMTDTAGLGDRWAAEDAAAKEAEAAAGNAEEAGNAEDAGTAEMLPEGTE